MKPEPLLLRPSEAAQVLGVGLPKVYAMVKAGELPSVMIGRSVRISVAGLKQWVARQSGEEAS